MKKAKFTIIDFFIVAVVIAVLVAGVYFLMPKNTEEKPSTVNFTVLATEQDKGVGSLFEVGDDVIISYSADVHATVVGVREEDRTEYFFNNFTGKYVSAKVENKSDVYIDLTCDADVTDTEIVTDYDLAIRVGDKMPVRKKGGVINGFVVDVQVEGE